MKKIIAIALTLVLTLTMLAGCGGSSAPAADSPAADSPAAEGEKLKIGIIQIVEHPSLDQIRTTFVDELAALGYDDSKVEIDYQNAQNEMSNVTSICQKFVGDEVDMIVAIATPSAQGAAAATTDIPILFSAVTDPLSAELVDDMNAPGGNCTGTSDAIPVEQIFSLADELTPGMQTYGFIYNLSEVNSVSVIEQCKAYLDANGLKYEEATVANVGELTTAAESLVGKVDAFFSPIDNTVASGMVTVAEIAKDNAIPYYVAADTMVYDGGLATVGVDYVQLGKQTASMAVEVLEGADPATMPVEIMENYATVVNPETAEALGVDVSKYAQ
ncbi:MAG: ABC transporter substrate-binding protein [Oscillospiraceae bacterium]|nr:ABC transporter substrate-binding protein [Oscillospiraceae bacterium]